MHRVSTGFGFGVVAVCPWESRYLGFASRSGICGFGVRVQIEGPGLRVWVRDFGVAA